MKSKYSLRVEHMTPQEINLVIDDFISCGWEPSSSWKLGDVHTFISFMWNKDTEPIYPAKHQPDR